MVWFQKEEGFKEDQEIDVPGGDMWILYESSLIGYNF